MSALSELRARLDARGVDHLDYHDVTEWGNGTFYATDVVCGFRLKDDKLVIRRVMTPAQAVEATLGRGECRITVQDNLVETDGMGDVWLECDACHWQMPLEPSTPRFNFCPNCGREVVKG